MRVSIELFLLDNWLMNAAVLVLGAAVGNLRLKKAPACLLSMLGAAYALFALWKWPILLVLPFRVLVGALLALGLRFNGWRGYMRALGCVLLSAFLLGGLMLALAYAERQPGMYGLIDGYLVGTVRLRVVLICAPIMAMLPRLFRHFRLSERTGDSRLRISVTMAGEKHEYDALLDTGNLLVEPVSGLPVVLLEHCPQCAGQPMPVFYEGVGSAGELDCYRPERAQVLMEGRWRDIDIVVAQFPQSIGVAQAILGSLALPPRQVGGGIVSTVFKA